MDTQNKGNVYEFKVSLIDQNALLKDLNQQNQIENIQE